MAEVLNKTEKILLNLYVQGKNRREMQEALGGAPYNTVSSALYQTRQKLGVGQGVELGQWLISRIPRDVLVKYI